MTPFEISVQFFLQLTVILAACRLVGMLAARLGQPQVVGEMIAGVLLGPSFFGMLAPEWQRLLFPPDTKALLFSVCQVGLVIYMFLVGVEFDAGLIRQRVRSAVAVSLSGILVPFALGAGVAWLLAGHVPLFSPTTELWEGMLFMGAAMAITAFPMLARIIYERGLTGTMMGTLALAAGSIDDALAWCLLAVVLAGFAGDPAVAFVAIGGGAAYAVVVALFGTRLLRRIAQHVERVGELSHPVLGAVLALLMLAAWFTDVIGIYAVFGAFLLGVAVPKGLFAHSLHQHLEKMTTAFLLPLFFVYSGLNTQLSILIDPALLGVTLLILFSAIAGKGIACAAAAWACGETRRDALAIGALMNARGLMELIILNIGLERGIITPALFSMMVVMAIVTTLMATPAFHWVQGGNPPR